MDQKPDQIINHIEAQRGQLGRNLNELEARVKRTTDWRAQFDRNPMLVMGVALGGGVLLGSIVAGRMHPASPTSWSDAKNYSTANRMSASDYAQASSGVRGVAVPSENRKKITDALENIKGALLTFGTAKLKEFISEALPGFSQHYDEVAQRNVGQSTPPWNSRDYSRSDKLESVGENVNA